MTLVLWTVAAIWGLSSVVVVTIFAMDERAHRRQIRSSPTIDAKIMRPSVRAESLVA